MSKNQLSLTPEITEAFAPAVLEVIRTSIAPTANDQEFLLFVHKAASYGLDPFKNEIFFIKYGNTARIQFAAEAYLSKAREKEGFIPPDTQMVHENDEFEIDKNAETKELEVVKHKIGFPRGKIIGAYSVAYREGYRPVTVISDIDEISHMFTGQNKDNWNKWTADMFGKHVQQRALKKQYGLEFEDETITHGEPEGGIPEYKPQPRKDITPNQDVIEPPKSQPIDPEEEKLGNAKAEMKVKFKKLGITTKKGMQDFISQNAPHIGDKPSLADIIGLNELLDMHYDMQEVNASDADILE